MVKYINNTNEYIVDIPGSIKLGDVIDIETGEVVRQLKELGIKFDTEPVVPEAPNDKSYDNTTKGFKFEANADAPSIGGTLSFEKANTVFIRTKGVKIERIKIGTQNKIGEQILTMRSNHKWLNQWCIVTELRYAKKSVIVASKANKAQIELICEGSDVAVMGLNQLIDFNIGFGSETNIGHKYFQEEGDYKSVAYKLKGINKKYWFSTPVFSTRGESHVTNQSLSDENDFLMDF